MDGIASNQIIEEEVPSKNPLWSCCGWLKSFKLLDESLFECVIETVKLISAKDAPSSCLIHFHCEITSKLLLIFSNPWSKFIRRQFPCGGKTSTHKPNNPKEKNNWFEFRWIDGISRKSLVFLLFLFACCHIQSNWKPIFED